MMSQYHVEVTTRFLMSRRTHAFIKLATLIYKQGQLHDFFIPSCSVVIFVIFLVLFWFVCRPYYISREQLCSSMLSALL